MSNAEFIEAAAEQTIQAVSQVATTLNPSLSSYIMAAVNVAENIAGQLLGLNPLERSAASTLINHLLQLHANNPQK